MHFHLLISVVFSLVLQISSIIGYLVNTEECKIPAFSAYSDEALSNMIPQNYTPCTHLKQLATYTTVNNNLPFLNVNKKSEIFKSHNTTIQPTCCYSYVTRNGTEEEPDVGISISDCIEFNSTNPPIQLEEPLVRVTCIKNSTTVYENVHYPIYITDTIRSRWNDTKSTKKQKAISVLFIVIDSVSKLNFHRTMSTTRNYLNNNGFVEFGAYNKIDDNTFPNAMALLSGMNLKQVYTDCDPKEVGKLDECPMIWYDFRDAGYATAYGEDWANYMTFNYVKKGFLEPPTDYYFRPYIEAAETLNVTFKDNMTYCTGPETEAERILKLAKDFAVTFKDKPSFGIFWMNTFSHNYIGSPKAMDEKVKDFFIELKHNKILDKSIVVLLSDHGIRFGKFRQTVQGWFEERLPIMSISIPPWFRYEYQEKYRNFLNNSRKLISTYDVYMTLQDVLNISSEYTASPSKACPKCQSLFSYIPEDRSCREAGIPEAWCTCVGEFTIQDPRLTNATINEAARLALLEIIRLEKWEPFSTSVTKILSSAVNLNRHRKSYLLFVVRTDSGAIYQILFRIKGDPVEFVRIVKVMRL